MGETTHLSNDVEVIAKARDKLAHPERPEALPLELLLRLDGLVTCHGHIAAGARRDLLLEG